MVPRNWLILISFFFLFPLKFVYCQEKLDLGSEFEGSAEVIDFASGKVETLIPPKPYELLHPEFKEQIDRQTYETMHQHYDDTPELLNSLRFSSSLHDLESFLNKMAEIRRHPRLIRSLNLSTDQTESIDKIEAEYLDDLEAMKLKQAPEIVMKRIKQHYFSELRQVIHPSQIDKFEMLSIERVGLPKLLTRTAYGDIVGLSESQKENIEAKSQILADEIKEFVAKKRKEAAELVYVELNEEQRKGVRELFEDVTLDSENSLPLEELFQRLDYKAKAKNRRKSDAPELKVWSHSRQP